MTLAHDAISTNSELLNRVTRFSKDRINSNVLQEITQDLDELEITSIIFLFTNENSDVSQIIQLLKSDSCSKLTELRHQNNWEEKLLEILIIVGNLKIVKKLGFNNNEIEAMKERFMYNIHKNSENLNRVIKSLYFVCEHLNKKEAEKLIVKVNESLPTPITLNTNKLWLELYILYWIQHGYLSIDEDKPKLNNLIQDLKSIGCLSDLPFNFDDWKNYNSKQQDISYTLKNDNSLQFTNNYMCNQNDNNYMQESVAWKGEHRRLCIIINQINFKNQLLYKTRLGSEKDEKNLEKTFSGCQFEIEKYQNFTKREMMYFLNRLNNQSYKKYACIFMCILSHGSKGEVVFSDDEKIEIDTIIEKFCCENLKNVFKFIILQSCQGQNLGLLNKASLDASEKLVTDGPTCPMFYKHFGLFQATINNFIALRHETEGSWFILDVCKEIRDSSPIIVREWTKRVTARLSARKAIYKDKDEFKDVVQLPICMNTITDDYEIPKFRQTL